MHSLGGADYPVPYQLYVKKNGVEAPALAGSIGSDTPDGADLPGCGDCQALYHTVTWP